MKDVGADVSGVKRGLDGLKDEILDEMKDGREEMSGMKRAIDALPEKTRLVVNNELGHLKDDLGAAVKSALSGVGGMVSTSINDGLVTLHEGTRSAVRDEVGGLKGNVATLKGEVGGLKSELGSLKSGFDAAVKDQVDGVKSEIGDLKSGFDGAVKDQFDGLKSELV